MRRFDGPSIHGLQSSRLADPPLSSAEHVLFENLSEWVLCAFERLLLRSVWDMVRSMRPMVVLVEMWCPKDPVTVNPIGGRF